MTDNGKNPMEGKPPGWYDDPDGVATNQAWWNGERWIETYRDPVTGKVTSPKKKPLGQWTKVWIAIGIALGIGAIYSFLSDVAGF